MNENNWRARASFGPVQRAAGHFGKLTCGGQFCFGVIPKEMRQDATDDQQCGRADQKIYNKVQEHPLIQPCEPGIESNVDMVTRFTQTFISTPKLAK